MARHILSFRLSGLVLATVALLGALLATPVAIADDIDDDEEGEWEAELSGDEEVPPVDTEAEGEASFEMSEDGSAILYEVEVEDIAGVFGGHIHYAPRGQNGPIVVCLYPSTSVCFGAPTGEVEGVLVTGSITAADLTGPLTGMTLGDLIALLNSGNAYVNFHTLPNHPGGEIRGQVEVD